MKKIIFLLVSLFLFSGTVLANPPADIQITVKKDVVEIVIKHLVENALQHYINAVEVRLNGEVFVRQSFKIQRDKDSQTLIYIVPGVKLNDKIEVKAECNITGDKKQEIIVTE